MTTRNKTKPKTLPVPADVAIEDSAHVKKPARKPINPLVTLPQPPALHDPSVAASRQLHPTPQTTDATKAGTEHTHEATQATAPHGTATSVVPESIDTLIQAPDQEPTALEVGSTRTSVEQPATLPEDSSPPPPTDVSINIAALTPAVSDWTLHARVLARGQIRPWSNLTASGKLLEVFLTDEDAAKFFDLLAPAATLSFTRGRVKYALRPHNVTHQTYELTFGETVSIAVHVPTIQTPPSLVCTRIANLRQQSHRTFANVVGILTLVGSTKHFVSVDRKPVVKREVLLVDESDFKVACTLWGQGARDPLDVNVGKPCLVTNGLLSNYRGRRSISVATGAAFMVEPAMPRGDELLSWYLQLPTSHDFEHLSVPE